MKNQNEGFIVPVLLAIIAVLVIGGGVYVYQNRKVEAPDVSMDTSERTTSQSEQNNTQTAATKQQNNSSVKAESNLDITLDQILNSDGFVKGVKQGNKGPNNLPIEYVIKNKISFGDIDGDGHVEAVVPRQWCDASCGRMIYIYKNDNRKIISAQLNESANSSVKQDIDSTAITNGVISITKSGGPGAGLPTTTYTYKVKFVDGDLRSLDQTTGRYVSQNVTNSDFSFVYPSGGEKFKVGSTIKIKWSALGLASNAPVAIYLQKGNMAGSTVGITTNTGSFDWVIPATMDLGYTSLIDTNDIVYRFIIQLNQSGHEYYSSKFSITQ